MKTSQMEELLEKLKAKILSSKLIVRDLHNGKKFIFYNRHKYNRKCTQVAFILNDHKDEVRINFIYWPRYWAKVRFTKSFDFSSPLFANWLDAKIEDVNNHLNSPVGFSQLYLN